MQTASCQTTCGNITTTKVHIYQAMGLDLSSHISSFVMALVVVLVKTHAAMQYVTVHLR